MESSLLILMSITSILVIYWVIFGQRRYNNIFYNNSYNYSYNHFQKKNIEKNNIKKPKEKIKIQTKKLNKN